MTQPAHAAARRDVCASKNVAGPLIPCKTIGVQNARCRHQRRSDQCAEGAARGPHTWGCTCRPGQGTPSEVAPVCVSPATLSCT
eukprot:658389-Prymnesium_polylepis.1